MTLSLITGGAGFIGSNLADQLLAMGHKVTVVDNEYSDAHDQFYWNKDTYNVNCDIRDYKTLKNCMHGVDYVFHFAAEARIQPAILNPVGAISINSVGTCTVLQCAREAGVKKLMYSSTSAGYGMNSQPNVETQPDDCLNPYSVSKVNGEKLCKMYTDLFDLDTVIFRYFNAYGERQPVRGQYAPVIGIFLRQLAAGETLTIVGDCEQRRDFTYVKDIVNANIMAAVSNADKEAYGQVYNVGSGVNYSVNEVAAMISGDVKYIPPRLGEARISLANVDKIYKTFAWKPQQNLEEWVKKQIGY